jgi:hydrogenase-4 component B
MDGQPPLTRVLVRLGHLSILVGAVAGAIVALRVLAAPGAAPLSAELPRAFPFAAMSLSVDGLSAFFLLVVALVAAAAALYGPSYLGAHARAPLVQTGALAVFVACMALVCCAGDGVTFLLAWEGMTLASYVLVVSDTENEEHARAGLLYLVMAHAGTAALLVVFLALADRAHAFDLASLRAAARGLDPTTRTALFMLSLAGFGAKAGVVPLHVWLPQAHPAAPSHASALMSGVMLKVALYGIFRFGFDVLAPAEGPLPASWGWTVLLLGTVSALIGVLLALQQHDLKRLLAFHSVENVGIILIGAGVAMLLGGGRGAAPLATLALAASLLHTLNHAAFKGLLFLGAGSVIARTGIRDMEELGGLARRMPWTAWLFLLGAVAISALPPLNGFVSEWMTFQALLLGGAGLGGASGLLAGVAASMLALTGGLAAACFAKAFGVTFLGRPRSEHAEHARESPAPMIAGMLLLAGACVALGLAPGYAMRLLDRPTAELLGGPGAVAAVTAHGPLVLSARGAPGGLEATAISMTAAAAVFGLVAVAAWAALRTRSRARRLAPTWTCGMTPTSRFDYTATAFAKPLRLIFAALYRPRREIVREPGASPYVLRRIAYAGEVVDLAETVLYARLKRWVTGSAHFIRAYSTGRIHGYIGFVLVTLVVTLLLYARA